MTDLITRIEAAKEPGRGWEPVNFILPPKWYVFFGRRLGRTTIGMSIAFCPVALIVGIELFTGETTGFGLALGPVWIGAAILRAERKDDE